MARKITDPRAARDHWPACGAGQLTAHREKTQYLNPMPLIRVLSHDEVSAKAGLLAEVLLDAVAGGASVGFMAVFSRAEAEAYWQRIAADAREGKRIVFAAGGVDGTAQLILDTPANQPHRGELAKMLVHRRARRRGLGRALFGAVEAEARRRGRT